MPSAEHRAMATRVHHPVFARIYARVSKAAEAKGAAVHRNELLAGLTGRVVEVGTGNWLARPSQPWPCHDTDQETRGPGGGPLIAQGTTATRRPDR